MIIMRESEKYKNRNERDKKKNNRTSYLEVFMHLMYHSQTCLHSLLHFTFNSFHREYKSLRQAYDILLFGDVLWVGVM